MKRAVGILAVGGGLILVSWVTSPSARTPPAEPAVSAADLELARQTTQAVTPLAAQIDDQAARLRARLLPPPPKPEPSRNPFHFGKRDVPHKGSDPRGLTPRPIVEEGYVPLASPPPAAALTLPSLVAITSDARDGGLFRTAVLSMDDEMKIVKPGQVFDRFIVEAIGPESVRIVDITSPARVTFVVAIR